MSKKCIAAFVLVPCIAFAGVGGDGPYQVTKGACGKLVFIKKIANNYESALANVAHEMPSVATKTINGQTTQKKLRLSPRQIEVNGAPTGVLFYGLEIVDQQTGVLEGTMSTVITSDGRRFNLIWCLD